MKTGQRIYYNPYSDKIHTMIITYVGRENIVTERVSDETDEKVFGMNEKNINFFKDREVLKVKINEKKPKFIELCENS